MTVHSACRLLIFLSSALIATSPVLAQETLPSAMRTKLETQLATVAEHLDGVMGYAIKDLATGESFTRMPDTVFPQASSIKLTILLELLRQAQEGKLSLSEKHILVRSEMTRNDSEAILNKLGDGTVSMSLRDLATFMVVLSDNTAANILIDRLGMENINSGINHLGLRETKLRRRMIDLEAARKGNENVSTPREMLTLLESVRDHKALDDEHSKEYFEILRLPKESEFHRALPDDAVIADKPGSLEGVRCDTGLIDLPSHPFIISVMTTYLKHDSEGDQAVEDVARLAYDYFSRLSRSSPYGRVISYQ